MALGNPASTQPLLGIYNVDEVPSLTMQPGATITGATLLPAPPLVANTAITTVGAGTLTGAAIIGGYITRSGSVAAYSDTTDTAAAIVAAWGSAAYVGLSFPLLIKNTTNFAETILAGSNVTLSGNVVIPANSTGVFQVTFTSLTAVSLNGITVNGNSLGNNSQYNTLSGNTPLTLTGAQMAGAPNCVINLSATLAGAGTLNSATAAQIVAAIPNAAVGNSYTLRVINASSGNFAWTLTTATGITLTGTMSIAQNTWRDFSVSLTSLTAVIIQSIGTGTNS